jgi:hypothetical protein
MQARQRDTEAEVSCREIGLQLQGLPERGGGSLVMSAIQQVPADLKRGLCRFN